MLEVKITVVIEKANAVRAAVSSIAWLGGRLGFIDGSAKETL